MDKIIEILKSIKPEYDFANSNNFIDEELLDSFDIVLLVSALEEAFGIQIDGLDILPENFETLESIANLIKKSGGRLA